MEKAINALNFPITIFQDVLYHPVKLFNCTCQQVLCRDFAFWSKIDK